VHDSAGNRLATTDPLGRITTFQYDSAGNRTKIIHPDKTEITFTYNALGQMIAETNELGHTTKKQYDPYGNLVAVTTPEGHTTRTLFGESGTGLQPVVSPTGAAANATPSSKPQALSLRPGSAARHLPHAIISPSGITTAFYYDLLGRKITVTKAPGTPEAATTTHQFDAVGNEIASLTPTGIKTTHTYDARRRRIATTDAINRTWTFTYTDTAGPSGAPPCCGADPASNSRAATTIHPDGTRDEKLYNALGQLIESRDANITTANDELRTKNQEQKSGIRYAYDEDGRLTTLTDARGSVTKWRYDARGKLQSKTYPDNTVEAYEHDAAGQLVSRLRPNGVSASYTYSPRGQLLTIRWSDDKTEPSTFAYDAAGNMTLAENHSAKITRTHTPEGRLLQETQRINYATVLPPGSTPQAPSPFVAEVGYQYNPDGKLSQLLYPDQSTISYLYNERGDLEEVQDSEQTLHPQLKNQNYRYSRRSDGRITSLSMPNGTTTTRTYDPVGRLSEIQHTAPDGSILFSEASRYDDRNRRTARVHGGGSADLFAYDPAGQVTAAAYGQSGAAVQADRDNPKPETWNLEPNQIFAYDPAGNRTSFTDNDTTTTYAANEANQYTSITAGTGILEPQFDPVGNLLHDDQNTCTWDSDIHLLSVETKVPNQKSQLSNFRYDALHRRVARTESATNTTTLFVMDGWNVIFEFSSRTNQELIQSLRLAWSEDISGTLQGAGGIGGLVSTQNKGDGYISFFHCDSNSNVAHISDVKGKSVAQYQYDTFGKTKLAKGSIAMKNRYQFSTKQIEQGNGLMYYGYRYYSSSLGRWACCDPIKNYSFVAIYSQGEARSKYTAAHLSTEFASVDLNLYAAMENSAENNHDLLGLIGLGLIVEAMQAYFDDPSNPVAEAEDLDDCLRRCNDDHQEDTAWDTAAWGADMFESAAASAAHPIAGAIDAVVSTCIWFAKIDDNREAFDLCRQACNRAFQEPLP
jgi:RHS repeat-associated protein